MPDGRQGVHFSRMLRTVELGRVDVVQAAARRAGMAVLVLQAALRAAGGSRYQVIQAASWRREVGGVRVNVATRRWPNGFGKGRKAIIKS